MDWDPQDFTYEWLTWLVLRGAHNCPLLVVVCRLSMQIRIYELNLSRQGFNTIQPFVGSQFPPDHNSYLFGLLVVLQAEPGQVKGWPTSGGHLCSGSRSSSGLSLWWRQLLVDDSSKAVLIRQLISCLMHNVVFTPGIHKQQGWVIVTFRDNTLSWHDCSCNWRLWGSCCWLLHNYVDTPGFTHLFPVVSDSFLFHMVLTCGCLYYIYGCRHHKGLSKKQKVCVQIQDV